MIGILLALVSTVSWAFCSIVFKKLMERIEAIGMTTITSILGAVFLFCAAIILHSNILIDCNSLILIALSGILGISIGDSLYYASLNRLSVFLFSLIMFMGPDFFSGAFGVIFLKEFPPLIVWIGIVLTLVGLGFFIFPIDSSNCSQNNKDSKKVVLGIVFAILSLCCSAYSMVIIKPMVDNTSAIIITMYRMLFSAVALIIFGLITKRFKAWITPLKDKNYSLKLILSMFIVTFGGFYLALAALRYSTLVVVSAITSLGPLFVFLFMVLFAKYKPKKKEYLAVLLIFLGIILICKG